MRTRFKPYARPELDGWPHFFRAPKDQRGNWSKHFSNPNKPLRLELGCGKGMFIANQSIKDSAFNYLGVDIKNEMLVVAKRNIENQYQNKNLPIENVALTAYNIEKIEEILSPEDSINCIYINFCNPWYKSGDAKHRLTHPRQLIQYRDFLIPNGEIRFKTDDLPLFKDSLRYFAHTGFEVIWQTQDLHSQEPDWNIRTEHEQMFSNDGISINACIAVMKPALLDKTEFSRMKNL